MIPAFVMLPEEYVAPGDAEQFARLRATFVGRWQSIVEKMRARRPTWPSEAERACIDELAVLTLDCLEAAPDVLLASFHGLERAYDDLLEREIRAADVERKLAFRWLATAFDHYFVATAPFRAAFSGLTMDELRQLVPRRVRQSDQPLEITPVDAAALRMQLDLLVALDLRNGDAQEFAWWSQRALHCVREHEPALLWALRGDGYALKLDLKSSLAVMDMLENPPAPTPALVEFMRHREDPPA